MPSTKMFRDRVVSMEQTYEKGEKLLPLLQTLVGEAIPGLTFQEYMLDHEQDCFVMLYRTESGAEKKVSWTRMVLSDPERIPAVVENAASEMRGRIVEFIRRRSERPFISVTFRHLEDGWIDTPEPKKPKPKPQQPQQRQKGQAPAPRERGVPPPAPGRGPQPQRGGRDRGASPRPSTPPGPPQPRPAALPVSADGQAAQAAQAGQTPPPEGGGRRRRFRRRRGRGRGRGPGSGAPPASPPPGGAGTP